MPLSQLPARLPCYLHSDKTFVKQCRHQFSRGLLAISLLGAAINNSAMAQTTAINEKSPADWFQIELVVFTQPNTKLTQEYWNEQLQPTYADDAVLLLPTSAPQSVEFIDQQPSDPEPAKQPQSNALINAEQQEPLAPPSLKDSHATLASQSGRQMPELYQQLYPQQRAQAGAIDRQSDQSSPGDRTAIFWPQQLPQLYQDGAYSLLSAKQLAAAVKDDTEKNKSRNNQKAALTPMNLKRLQKKGHRILFHGNWRQPVVDLKHSHSILIRGGNPLDSQHFELEGDIKLSLNRYLHLWPQLYLTVPLPQDWQPRDPRAIQALATAEQMQLEYQQQIQQREAQKPATAQDNALADTASEGSLQSTISSSAIASGSRGLADSPLLTDGDAEKLSMVSDSTAQAPKPIARYLTVKMDKPRRMRSRELHYLDHPLFGLLIRITPYRLPSPVVVEPAGIEPKSVEPAVVKPEGSQPRLGAKTNTIAG